MRKRATRLRALKSFAGIARATRTLAAAQVLQWSDHHERAQHYLRWCATLSASYGLAPPAAQGWGMTLAIGSDLGLCGSLNARVAAVLASLERDVGEVRVVIGTRLALEVGDDAHVTLPAPNSFAAVEQLASAIDALEFANARTRLRIVVCASVRSDGRAEVRLLDGGKPVALEPVGPSPADLSPPRSGRVAAAGLLRHARVVDALTQGARSEAEARLRAMSRAHEAADQRIALAERELVKLGQEAMTQEMLELRQGKSARGPVRNSVDEVFGLKVGSKREQPWKQETKQSKI